MLGFAVILGVAVIILSAIAIALFNMWIRHRLGKAGYFPYRRATSLLPDAELAWYRSLVSACEGLATVHCRVRLWDLVTIPSGTKHPTLWRNRVWHKHADMVVCEPGTVRPLAVVVIETQPGRGTSGRVDDLRLFCKAAGLPMVLIEHDSPRDVPALRARLERVLAEHPGKPAASIAQEQLAAVAT